ncbi:sugar porter family MFS transporter [Kiritimatiella glycovorans]|uniref:D-xylose transporter n=1 Tax=Kiritimatiella glycovorans TaxID=1307763 RepID=A0A0G3EDQ5_9BACT|nr:sugar porter family MFS transporter [Kiritimatiella glycovorans]AKJ64581.1 D-xylose transporter [Kiritimatiella glycovorans]
MNVFVFLLSCVAALGGFLFGFDSGVINGTVGALQEAFGTSEVGSGFNVASMLLGCAAGAFFAGRIADWLGRRWALIVAAVCFGVSAWGSGIAGGSVEFVIYRLIGGIAVGGASIISPAYISEIAPAAVRGRLASLQQMAIVLGLFVAFLSNFLLAGVSGGASDPLWGFQTWQWMFWMELIPVVLFFLGLICIPESPRFLVARGKYEKAESVLARVDHPDDAPAKVEQIRGTLNAAHRPSLRDVRDTARKRIYPIVWVGILLAAFQQLVGINVIFYYGEVLWEAAGFTEENALLINVISGAINIGSTIVAILLVDRVGRKPLLVWGSAGMAVFLGLMALIFAGSEVDASGNLALTDMAGVFALLAANGYIICFAVTWGPVMWVLLGEMFPNQMRGAALSLAGLSQWATNFVVTITFPMLLSGIGLGGAYACYAFFALLSVFFAWKLIAETRGKTLEEMTGG